MLTDTSNLFRLVYRSRCALDVACDDAQAMVDAIVDVSRRKNADAQITGTLMYTHRFFVQALEGPAAAVEAAFDRIACDLRHRDLEIVECSPVLERSFGEWSMRQLVPDLLAKEQLDPAADARALSDAAALAMKLMVAITKPLTAGLAPA